MQLYFFSSQEVAQPNTKRRFAVVFGTPPAGGVPTERKVRIIGYKYTLKTEHCFLMQSGLVNTEPAFVVKLSAY